MSTSAPLAPPEEAGLGRAPGGGIPSSGLDAVTYALVSDHTCRDPPPPRPRRNLITILSLVPRCYIIDGFEGFPG